MALWIRRVTDDVVLINLCARVTEKRQSMLCVGGRLQLVDAIRRVVIGGRIGFVLEPPSITFEEDKARRVAMGFKILLQLLFCYRR